MQYDPSLRTNFPLYPYQEDAVRKLQHCLDYNRGQKISVLKLPTGAGKTRVANELVYHWLKQNSRSIVLWVAPNWELLSQAADAMAGYFPIGNKLRRIGGSNGVLANLSEPGNNSQRGSIHYTTLQTWNRRHRRKKYDLIVYDESHWGHTGYMADAFFNFYLKRERAVLGLSATPKEHNLMHICCEYSYSQLAKEGYLATPIVIQVNTGISWSPLVRRDGFIIEESFNELAQSTERNKLICSTLIKGQKKYQRVMVFACNISHAETLVSMLSKNNISAMAVHCLVNDLEKKRSAIEKFRSGQIQVLVNVQMCTHGIDIPEIDTVVLARPTDSPILCAQMVGRGARIIPGIKNKFFILEFTDNIKKHGVKIFHANGLFEGSFNEPAPAPHDQRQKRVKKHFISDAPKFEILHLIPDVDGINFVVDQTFGVEIELTSKNLGPVPYEEKTWREIAAKIIKKLTDNDLDTHHIPGNYHHLYDITDQWKVEADSSAGWEIISPILVGKDGFEELYKACKALSDFCSENKDITVDHKTGLHITLATKLNTNQRLQGFLKRVQRLEPGLFSLVAPSRLFKFDGVSYQLDKSNDYCEPVRHINVDDLILEDFLYELNNRYYSVNVTRFQDDLELLEVRMHHGTTNYRKIIPWISLWMNIFNRSRYKWQGPASYGKVYTDLQTQRLINEEDIFNLLRKDNIYIPLKLEQLLRKRRQELKPNWENSIPDRVKLWERAGWYVNIDNSIIIEDYTPQNCPNYLAVEFENLLQLSGQVSQHGLTVKINHAEKLLFLYCEMNGICTLAGIAALKFPNQIYKNIVFKESHSENNPNRFTHEVGWIFVKEQFRGQNYSYVLLKKLLNFPGNNRVYATTREDNKYIRRAMERSGLKISGQPYIYNDGDHRLVLYVK